MFPLFGVPIGMVIGSELGHLTLGSFICGGFGFSLGLALLVWMRKRSDA